jgi:hypothetical protein
VASWVRDEIRQVSPGLYLGIVFLRGRRLPLRFALRFTGSTGAEVRVVDEAEDRA